MAPRLSVWLLAVALLATAAFTAGCGRKPLPQGTPAPASPAMAPGAARTAEALPPGTAPPSYASVVARPVTGWGLQESPRPGIAYRYVREQAEGEFRPTVSVVARGAKVASPSDARERAFAELRERYPGIETLSDRAIGDWKPPLHQTTYRVTEQGATHQLMQLYFVRSDGELVTVTFCAQASQWAYLESEFRSILNAIEVAP